MTRMPLLFLFLTLMCAPVIADQGDWPWWRGPDRNGTAAADQNPPQSWSETKNIVWKQAIPGKGHGSITVVGDRVFLATAELAEEVQSVLCLDRKTGKVRWKSAVHRGGLEKKGNKKASLASSSLACDGKQIYINFLNNGAIHTTAIDLQGKRIWQTKVTDYTVHQGYGSSPAIYGSLVIVSGDNKGGGAVAGLDRATGKIAWIHDRPQKPNYASPIILHVAGRDQLLFTGCDLVSSYDPQSGRKLWEIAGSTTECVTSTVSAGDLIFTSGGYPRDHLSAIRADGSGEIVWENTTRVYVPSMLVHDGHLFAIRDNGVACCWNAQTGKLAWKERVGGTFSSSPIRVGMLIYATNEAGETVIIEANPSRFNLVGRNQLGDEVMATPSICGSRIFQRVAKHVGNQRQEMLYCIGHVD